MIRHLLRRLWLVVVVAAVAGVAAWGTTLGEEVRYEARLTYLIQPADSLPNENVADALRGLAQESGQLKRTVAAVLSTGSFLDLAVDRGLERDPGPGYDVSASAPGSSDLLVVAVSGPDAPTVERIATAFTPVAAQWLADVYRSYQLEVLSASRANEIATDGTRTIVLGALLGALLALGAAFAEGKAREVRARELAEGIGDGAGVLSIENLAGRADLIEESLRERLEDGERVVRLGPNRLRIVRGASEERPQARRQRG